MEVIAKLPFLFSLTPGHTLNIIEVQKQIHENVHFLEKGGMNHVSGKICKCPG